MDYNQILKQIAEKHFVPDNEGNILNLINLGSDVLKVPNYVIRQYIIEQLQENVSPKVLLEVLLNLDLAIEQNKVKEFLLQYID